MCHLISINGFNDGFGFLFQGLLEKRSTGLRVEFAGCNEIVRDGGRRYTKHVRNDSIKGNITNSESILKTVPFTGLTGIEFITVTCVLT